VRFRIVFISILALMAIALVPLGIALAQGVSPGRVVPDAVRSGETFDVTVNFAAPVDKLNAIGLTDLCPDGWDVTVDKTWCTPNADAVLATGNKAEISWFGELNVGFDKDTSFTALYKVAVPDDASTGIYGFDGFLEYYVATEGPYLGNITGGSQVEVVGGGVIGVWWIVGIVVAIAVIVAAVLLVRRRKA
jgi:hypothetical protein